MRICSEQQDLAFDYLHCDTGLDHSMNRTDHTENTVSRLTKKTFLRLRLQNADAVEEADVDESALQQTVRWDSCINVSSTHISISLAAVDFLTRIASVSDGENIAKKLANDRNGRVAASNLAVVAAVDVASTA